jgi:hypothetical protein
MAGQGASDQNHDAAKARKILFEGRFLCSLQSKRTKVLVRNFFHVELQFHVLFVVIMYRCCEFQDWSVESQFHKILLRGERGERGEREAK